MVFCYYYCRYYCYYYYYYYCRRCCYTLLFMSRPVPPCPTPTTPSSLPKSPPLVRQYSNISKTQALYISL